MKTFETSDFILAASIIAGTGTQPVSVDGAPEHVRYEFGDDESVQLVVRAYRVGTMRVDPILFSAAQQYLRMRVRDAIDHDGNVK